MDQSTQNPGQLSGCFLRLLWMAVGNLILVLSAIGIAQNGAGFSLECYGRGLRSDRAVFACRPIRGYSLSQRQNERQPTGDDGPLVSLHGSRSRRFTGALARGASDLVETCSKAKGG